MSWYVYLLSCSDGSLYTGITRDPLERTAAHNRGAGASYTRGRLPAELAYLEPAPDRPAALRRELEVKALPRSRKLELIDSRRGLEEHAPLLTLPGFGATHGFATRAGGVSQGPYRSLNLGAGTDDDPACVARNRATFAGWFGLAAERLSLLDQVHGTRVVSASAGRSVEADAQISDDPSLLLVVGAADCLPLLFFDPHSGAVGAAHCGWRGTSGGLAAATVAALGDAFGCPPERVRVAIGPGICRACYQVGEEVVERFREGGFPDEVAEPDDAGRWRLDLATANAWLLERSGVPAGSIHLSRACTSCRPELYYSHRRDRGLTGRHWAAVRAGGGAAAGAGIAAKG